MCRKQIWIVWVGGLLTWLTIAAVSSDLATAADLRTERGSRRTTRQVAYQPRVIDVEVIEDAGPIPGEFHGGCGGGGCHGCSDCGGGWPGQGGCASCGDVGFGCGVCGAGCGYYGKMEFLLWWRQGRSVPPLISTSPAGTAQGAAGVLDQPATTLLLGNERLGQDNRPGGRITVGKWLGGGDLMAVEGRFFSLATSDFRYDIASAGDPIVARPFFNSALNRQDSRLIGFPNIVQGSVNVTSQSDALGGDVLFRGLLCRYPCARLDLVAGYQYGRIDEDLQIQSVDVVVQQGGNIAVGTTTTLNDIFETENEYHAGTIGLQAEWYRGPLQFNLLGKIGFGTMSQSVRIDGFSSIAVPGQAVQNRNGGLLALPSNEGLFTTDDFAVSPELNFTVTYPMTHCLDVSFGYTFIYYSSVVQPGDQIDLAVNPSQSTGTPVGPLTPQFQFRQTDYWLQGIHAGVTARF